MKFKLGIKLGNEAMESCADIGNALVHVGKVIQQGGFYKMQAGHHGRIKDLNGNAVGSWEVFEDKE